MMLYPNGIKWGKHRPTVEDLRALAHFNRIVMNYLKMEELLKEPSEKKLGFPIGIQGYSISLQ